jgi:hypothetical protein
MRNGDWATSLNVVPPVVPNVVTVKKAEGAAVVEAAVVEEAAAVIAVRQTEAERADSSLQLPIAADDASSSRPLVQPAAKRRPCRSVP